MKAKTLITMALAGAMFCACDSSENINSNPNDPTEVSPQLLLPKVCQSAFYRGTDGMYADKMVVQTDGKNSEQFYEWNRGSFNDYNQKLLQVVKMKEEADREGDDTYDGLYHFFRAYYFYNLTLKFGDIPYSEALKGESDAVFTPKYDTQEEVFAGILDELATANDDLAVTAKAQDIINGDIIYSGSAASWQRLVNSFRLKVLLTLSKKTTVGTHNIKQEFAQVAQLPLITGNDQNGQITYIDQEGNRYPQFNAQWSGFYMDKTFIDRMADRQDPRLFLFALPTNEAANAGKGVTDFTAYAGGDPTVPYGENKNLVGAGRISQINSRYRTNATGEPTVLLGYAELQQILAEAAVRGWISGSAQQYYEQGVRASFEWYNTYAGDYAQYVTAEAADKYLQGDNVKWDDNLTAEQKIERIIFQKYCVSFFQGGWSPFFEHLRTGYPSFAHLADSPVPYRWMYPETESKYNTQNVEDAVTRQFGANNDKITAKPWWLTD